MFAVIVLGAVITALPRAVYAAAAFQAQAPANSYVQPARRVGRVVLHRDRRALEEIQLTHSDARFRALHR